ncbi:MAG: T9SS C-terminal target domain-containing protein, partial [Ignavibacteriae bacterium]
MKFIISILMVLFFTSSLILSQDAKKGKLSQAKENGSVLYLNTAPTPTPFLINTINPVGAIPNLKTFADYVTNGNHLRKLFVFGDTVVVGVDYLDTNFVALTERRIRYNVSFNGGNTWSSDVLVVNTTEGQAYSDFTPIYATERSVGVSGRQYVGSTSRGFAGSELSLGLGSFTSLLNPGTGRDYFAQSLNSSELAGSYLSSTQDTIYFIKYNFVSNTFGTPVVVSAGATEVEASARHSTTTASNGQNVFILWYYAGGTFGQFYAKESVNGGTSFGSLTTVLSETAMVGGDSVEAWLNSDFIYKPGTTNKCAVLQTVAPGTSTSRRGYKILFWSPTINGGNPVKIADWQNANIPLLNDSILYTNDTAIFQVNMAYVSNPTLAYTNDGSRLICAFQVGQPEYTSYSYHYYDIYTSYSDNDGATWSNPINITNTPNIDEIYPTLSKSGNTANDMKITFLVSECPGSNSFNQITTPRCPNYWVYRRYDPVTGSIIGINTISSEVPQSFKLHQNYPNPFNPSTKIRFELPKSEVISLKIYDLLGKEVAAVVNNEFTTAGVKEVEFNASQLASGVYYYVLKAGNLQESKKM